MADLSDEEKLVWLGLKQPKQEVTIIKGDLNKLQDALTFEQFQSDLDDVADFSELNTYLQNEANFSSDEADSFIEKIQQNFSDEDSSGSVYDEFKDYTQNTATTWETFKNNFGNQATFSGEVETESGEPAAGIRVHDQNGVSYDGVVVPAGTVEVFGTRVEFSQQDTPFTGEALISYSNLQVSNTIPEKFETITISADIDNIGDVFGDAYPQLKIDGEVVSTAGPITIPNGGSDSIEFTWTFTELQSVEMTIGALEPETVSVIPTGLFIL